MLVTIQRYTSALLGTSASGTECGIVKSYRLLPRELHCLCCSRFHFAFVGFAKLNIYSIAWFSIVSLTSLGAWRTLPKIQNFRFQDFELSMPVEDYNTAGELVFSLDRLNTPVFVFIISAATAAGAVPLAV